MGSYKNLIIVGFVVSSILLSGCVNNVKKSQEWIDVEEGEINKSVKIDDLQVDVQSYKIIRSIEDIPQKYLILSFSVTNTGNELEHYPEQVVLVLSNGKQIFPAKEQIEQCFGEGIEKILHVNLNPKEDIYPGATEDFSIGYLVPSNFDFEDTTIEVLYNGEIKKI